eukprot:gene1622-12747_t
MNEEEFSFPILNDISRIREAIEETKEKIGKCFYEIEKNNQYYFNYRFYSEKTFPNPKKAKNKKEKENFQILRELRGLVFDKNTGKCINRPFHKFFNINGELEECNSKNINLKGKEHYWLEKLDGSMVTAILIKEENDDIIRFKTKMGFNNEVSNKVEEFIFENQQFYNFSKENELKNESKVNIILFSKHWLDEGFTPIFEFTSPKNQIIIEYQETKLILIGIRNNLTGQYVKYMNMKESAEKYKVEIVKNYEFGDDLESGIEKISQLKNIEGFVLNIENQNLYKVKSTWYRKLHDSTNKFQIGKMSEAELWIKVLDNEMDEVFSVLTKNEDVKRSLKNFSENLWKKMNKEFDHLTEISKSAPNSEKNFKKFFKYHELNEVEIEVLKAILSSKEEDEFDRFVSVLKSFLKNRKKIPENVLEIITVDGSQVLKLLKISQKNEIIENSENLKAPENVDENKKTKKTNKSKKKK